MRKDAATPLRQSAYASIYGVKRKNDHTGSTNMFNDSARMFEECPAKPRIV